MRRARDRDAPAARRTPWERPPWRIAGVRRWPSSRHSLALLARLVQVQLLDGERYRAAARANQIRLIPIAAPRGLIYDRNGAVLVRSRPSFVVALIPSEVTDIDGELATLARTLGLAEAKLWDRLLHHRGVNYHDFDEVATYEPYGPVILASDLPVANVARLSEVLTDLPGVDLEVQPVRNYPLRRTRLAHLRLRRRDHRRRIRAAQARKATRPTTSSARTGSKSLRPLSARHPRRPAHRGRRNRRRRAERRSSSQAAFPATRWSRTSTGALQPIADKALATDCYAGGAAALAGAVVAIDPWTGGILAMASYPTFDPNDFATDRSRRDRALSHRSAAAALQPRDRRGDADRLDVQDGHRLGGAHRGVVKADQVLYDTGAWNCGGYSRATSPPADSATRLRAGAGRLERRLLLPARRGARPRRGLRYYALRTARHRRPASICPANTRATGRPTRGRCKTFGVPIEPSDVFPRRSAKARCKRRRCRWPTSRRPSSTAARSTARTSCARFAARTAQSSRRSSTRSSATFRSRKKRSRGARGDGPGHRSRRYAAGLGIAVCRTRARPERPRPRAATVRTRPGSSPGRRRDHPKSRWRSSWIAAAATARRSQRRSRATSSSNTSTKNRSLVS